MLNSIQAKVVECINCNKITIATLPRRSGKSYLVRELSKKYDVIFYSGLAKLSAKRFGLGEEEIVVVEEPDFLGNNTGFGVSVEEFFKTLFESDRKVLVIGSEGTAGVLHNLMEKGKSSGWATITMQASDFWGKMEKVS